MINVKIINEIEERRNQKQFEKTFVNFFAGSLNLELEKGLYHCEYKLTTKKKRWYNFKNDVAEIDFWGKPRITLFGECHIEKFKEAIKEWENLHKGQEITLIVKKGDC